MLTGERTTGVLTDGRGLIDWWEDDLVRWERTLGRFLFSFTSAEAEGFGGRGAAIGGAEVEERSTEASADVALPAEAGLEDSSAEGEGTVWTLAGAFASASASLAGLTGLVVSSAGTAAGWATPLLAAAEASAEDK